MANGWTGGQYSLFRIAFGLCLFVRIAAAIAHAAAIDTAVTIGLLVAEAVLAACFAAGAFDRVAAIALVSILGWGAGWHGLPFVFVTAWPLLAHVLLPPAPYGLLSARNRVAPRGGWRFHPALLAATRVAVVAMDLVLIFAPPVGWCGAGCVVGVALAHLLAFDPARIRPARPGTTDLLFYDGTCGFCQMGVRLFLAEDRSGVAFRCAPIGGATWAKAIGERPDLPDSMVVRTESGETLVRSAAIIHMLKRLGGWWRVIGGVAGLVPRPLRDLSYDGVARARYRLFGRTKEACPPLPPDLRSRFDA